MAAFACAGLALGAQLGLAQASGLGNGLSLGARSPGLALPESAPRRAPMQRPQASAAIQPQAAASDAQRMGINVAGLLNRPAPVQYRLPQLSKEKLWDGTGEIPNAFQRPWSMPATNFDPSFITPFYSEATGVLNTASAPWNQFLPANISEWMYGPIVTMPAQAISTLTGKPVLASPEIPGVTLGQEPSVEVNSSAQLAI